MFKTEPDLMERSGRRGKQQGKVDLVDQDGNSKF